MNLNSNLESIKKINLNKNKILFLGYGGVAKCVLNYFSYYFNYDIKKIHIIDKDENVLYGPIQNLISKKNILFVKICSENFDYYVINKFKFKKSDLIIDLTFSSNTYYFVKRCLELDINYINTSIEDINDNFFGSSIALQQLLIDNIHNEIKEKRKISCNVLLEFGQNPGLIQHYIIYAFNYLNKLKNNSEDDIWDINKLKHIINDYKIGTILVSEIDKMVKKKENKKDCENHICNTWSVYGLLGEGSDNTELAYGKKNKFIKPKIPNDIIDTEKINIFNEATKNFEKSYDILFLKELGINSRLNTICMGINSSGEIVSENFQGRLIHHGEMFELANALGDNSPFISYCYKINKYAEYSLKNYMNKSDNSNLLNLKLEINNINNNFIVYDNYKVKNDDKIIGWDSVGCTIYCGKKNIESIYWCGSIMSSNDLNILEMFTPTIIQVAAGVLSGISYIMEPSNKNKGKLNPMDLYTPYILSKATPLLGKFFFTEIPLKNFNKKNINFDIDKII